MGLVRNLSVRVPWHDRAWDGHVCADPLGNSSCLALKLIAENRKDDIEAKIPNEAFDGLQPNQMPPCLRASGSFLSPRSYSFESVMSYSTWSKDHTHIQPRPVHIPAWGALTIKADAEKTDSLKLLARLELTGEQAERALQIEAKILLNNPYALFENDRTAYEPISFGAVESA